MTKNIEGLVFVYGLIDTHGNEWVGAADQPSDTIMVYGIYDTTGEAILFNAEAYNIESLAKDYDLKYGERRQWVTVDVE